MKKVLKRVLPVFLSLVLVAGCCLGTNAYVVSKGDTLGKIAAQYGLTVEQLAKWNNISDVNKIYVGQELIVDGKRSLSNKEKKALSDMFDAEYYAANNPDVVEVMGTEDESVLFEHFCNFGLSELRQPSEEFNVVAYAAAYDDLSKAFGTDIISYYMHYDEYGRNEERAITNTKAYTDAGLDVRLLESQQSDIGSDGRPQFTKFYDSEKGNFVYSGDNSSKQAPPPAPMVNNYHAALNTTTGELVVYYGSLPGSYEGFNEYDNPIGLNCTEETYSDDIPWANDCDLIKAITIDQSMKGHNDFTSTCEWFYNTYNVSKYNGFENLDVSNVTNMASMFRYSGYSQNTSDQQVPNVTNWNTAKVTSMNGMFYEFGHEANKVLGVPDVSGWNTGNVTDLSWMFYEYAYNDTSFNAVPAVDGWNTDKVVCLDLIFCDYAAGSTVLSVVPNVAGWKTSKVESMCRVFDTYGVNSEVLAVVPDVSGWDVSKAVDMRWMFDQYACNSKVINAVPDISNWHITDEQCISGLFSWYACNGTTISLVPDVSSWYDSYTGYKADVFSGYGNNSPHIDNSTDPPTVK